MDRQATEGDAARAGGVLGLFGAHFVAEAQDPLAGSLPRGDPAQDRGGGKHGEKGILRGHRVGQRGVGFGTEAAALQQTRQPTGHAPGHSFDVGRLRRRKRDEPLPAR